MSSSDSSHETTVASQSTSHSHPHPHGFVLSHLCRDFFLAYYRHTHNRTITDADILTLVNRAHDAAIARAHPYRCIKEYQFCYPRVMQHPHYAQLFQHNANVGQVRVLDVGSCMGSDLRQMILHGVKPVHALGLELEQDLIDIGLDVLYDDRAQLQHSFITQNVLDDNFLSNRQLANFHSAGIDVIYCGSVYHLLDEGTHPHTHTAPLQTPHTRRCPLRPHSRLHPPHRPRHSRLERRAAPPAQRRNVHGYVVAVRVCGR